MITVFSDFNGRVGEVDGYFRFVLRLAREEVALLEANTGGAAFSQSEHVELLKTLKAACYLLLYNLVESTMQNAVEAIFEELRLQSVVFDDCRDELKEEILKNFRSRNMGKLLPRLVTLARDVVHATFEKKETFSGNLDARTIRKTAKRFGFDEPRGSQFALLQTIKDLRNDLAHGVKSFAEVGRNATPSDLDQARIETVDILRQTLNNIQTYLVNREYRHTP